MPDPCEYIYETIGCAASFNYGQSQLVAEYIAMSTANTMSSYTTMRESIGCTDLFAKIVKPRESILEEVDLRDANIVGIKMPIMSEAIGVAGAFTFSQTVTMAESVGTTGLFTPKNNATVRMYDSIAATDRFASGFYNALSDSVGCAGVFTASRKVIASLAESAAATDAFSQYIKHFPQIVAESVTATSTVGHKATAYASVSESVSAVEAFWYRDAGQIAWQMNTETSAANWHTNFMFDSIAQYGNTVLAVAPDGIYVLEGNTDNNTAIPATVQTGFMDFDDKHVKRFGGVFFGLRGSSLRLSLEPFGAVAASEYDMPAKTTVSPGSNRIVPGKGLVSRYWRMTFKNVDGGDFDIDNIELDIASSNQRRL